MARATRTTSASLSPNTDDTSLPLPPNTATSSGKRKRGRPTKVASEEPADLVVGRDEEEEEGGEAGPSTSVLREGEATKLVVALKGIDAAGVLDSEVEVEGVLAPLREALRAGVSLAVLRDAFPRASTSSANDSSAHLVDSFRRTSLALLNEIEDLYFRERSGETSRGNKRENDSPDEGATPAKKFMLHRGLPTVDLFTSAAELSADDLAALVTEEDTDVIAVLPSSSSSDPAPTLGQVNTRPRVPPPPTTAKPTPVSFLYYDPFSSFAPSHDSTGSTLSYTSSTSHLQSLSALEAHRETSALPPSLPTIDPSLTPLVLSPEEEELLRALGVDPQAVKEGWESNLVDRTLGENGERLGLLLRGQWERLRKGEPTNEVENQLATDLLLSLAALVANRPAGIVPTSERVRELVPRVMRGVGREEGWRGTLDEVNYRAVKESEMVKEE